MKKVLFVFILAFALGVAHSEDTDYNLINPYHNSNNPYSAENNPYNNNNNPYNSENNPYNLRSQRIIRDNDGNPIGYAVPRSDGGVNYFEYGKSGRQSYQPGRAR